MKKAIIRFIVKSLFISMVSLPIAIGIAYLAQYEFHLSKKLVVLIVFPVLIIYEFCTSHLSLWDTISCTTLWLVNTLLTSAIATMLSIYFYGPLRDYVVKTVGTKIETNIMNQLIQLPEESLKYKCRHSDTMSERIALRCPGSGVDSDGYFN